MNDDIIMALMGAAIVFLGVGWYTTARAARLMAQINLAQIKGMHHTLTGRELDDDED